MNTKKCTGLIIIIAVIVAGFYIYSTMHAKQAATQKYKVAQFDGEIPVAWSEYGNGFGFISKPVNDAKILKDNGYDSYAKYVTDSVGPGATVFSDESEGRLDTFIITPALKDKFIADAKKQNIHSTKVIGAHTFDVISIDSKDEGGIKAEYLLDLPKASDGTAEVALFIEYPSSDASFAAGIQHYLSTIKF